MCMPENPEQDSLPTWFRVEASAKRLEDLGGVVSQAKLEDASAELLAVWPTAHHHALLLENLAHATPIARR